MGRTTFSGTFADTFVSSADAAVRFQPHFQEGTVAIATRGAYGSSGFFRASAITFSTPFDTEFPIVVTATAEDGAGGYGATVDSISHTGATIRAFGYTSGGTVSVRWYARGRLAKLRLCLTFHIDKGRIAGLEVVFSSILRHVSGIDHV